MQSACEGDIQLGGLALRRDSENSPAVLLRHRRDADAAKILYRRASFSRKIATSGFCAAGVSGSALLTISAKKHE